MQTDLHMLNKLLKVYHPKERGIFSDGEYELIRDTLCLKEMNILQLRNLRNFTVLYLGRGENDMENFDRMSAITYCIDSRIVELGGEV